MKAGQYQHSVSTCLNDRQFEQFTRLAAQEGTTKAVLARRAIERLLASSSQGEALVRSGGPISPGRPWEIDE